MDVDGQTLVLLVLLDDAVVFPAEVGGKFQSIAFCTVVAVGSLLALLGTGDMPPVTGVIGPDNSESKRSIGFFADGAFPVERSVVLVFGGVLGTLSSVEASNMAQLFSFDCCDIGGGGGVSGLLLLLFCLDGFSSTEPLPPGGLIYQIQNFQGFRVSGNISS